SLCFLLSLLCCCCLFLLPPSSPLFPYTTLFRSSPALQLRVYGGVARAPDGVERSVRGGRDAGGQRAHAALRAVRAADPDPLVMRSESTRLNSSHVAISYAVFCLKKKNKEYTLRR